MDIEITCNTDDAELFANIAANSRAHKTWVERLVPHDGHAVLVGGGPSLAENIGQIERRFGLGQKIFALNGAAKFLNQHDLVPDYQVILDARPENAGLIGVASQYLISSQCHHSVFAALPKEPILWHPALEGIDAHIPEHAAAYTMIGIGSTVGLSAMALVYALGYRKLHLFGYDSSHRDTHGHAYVQPMNDRDPLCKVTLGGKTFTSSWTMTRQAERFPDACNALIDLGCTITLDGDGLMREVFEQMRKTNEPIPEDEKYRQMWALPEYRAVSPGEEAADDFVSLVSRKHKKSSPSVIDFGCGSGRGGKRIRDVTGWLVLLVDFAENCRDAGSDLPFVLADITKPMDMRADVGYCTDVMEHIPTEDVPAVIANIMACVDACYFRIALFHDNMGALIGHPLHLSVFPAEWWEEKFAAYDIRYTRTEHTEFPTASFFVKHKRKENQ